jgi:hypothetical protein
MRAKFHAAPHAGSMADDARTRGAAVGLAGGLAGTIVMDLFGAALFVVMGGPPTLSFTIIGDAAAGFFAMLGVALAGGTALGALLHYLIGLALGGIFGAAVSSTAVLRPGSRKKAAALAAVYVEIMSQPLLVAAAVILRMSQAETAQWFGVSFVMHLVYGLVLGLVAHAGLRAAPAARPA